MNKDIMSSAIRSSNVSPGGAGTTDLHQYEYETHIPDNEKRQQQAALLSEPLPPERLARKQRHYDRRGGYVHSFLLKGAVMASMASIEEEPTVDGVRRPVPPARSDSSCLAAMQEALYIDGSQYSTGPPSPRKRVRRSTSRRSQEFNQMNVDDPLSEMFGVLSMPSADSQDSGEGRAAPAIRRPPMRRVSRRRSYSDRVKKASEIGTCVEEEEAEEDERDTDDDKDVPLVTEGTKE